MGVLHLNEEEMTAVDVLWWGGTAKVLDRASQRSNVVATVYKRSEHSLHARHTPRERYCVPLTTLEGAASFLMSRPVGLLTLWGAIDFRYVREGSRPRRTTSAIGDRLALGATAANVTSTDYATGVQVQLSDFMRSKGSQRKEEGKLEVLLEVQSFDCQIGGQAFRIAV